MKAPSLVDSRQKRGVLSYSAAPPHLSIAESSPVPSAKLPYSIPCDECDECPCPLAVHAQVGQDASASQTRPRLHCSFVRLESDSQSAPEGLHARSLPQAQTSAGGRQHTCTGHRMVVTLGASHGHLSRRDANDAHFTHFHLFFCCLLDRTTLSSPPDSLQHIV